MRCAIGYDAVGFDASMDYLALRTPRTGNISTATDAIGPTTPT